MNSRPSYDSETPWRVGVLSKNTNELKTLAPPWPGRDYRHQTADLWSFQKGRVLAQDGVHWYNTQRLLKPIGNVAPVEYEMNYYRSQEGSLEMARLN